MTNSLTKEEILNQIKPATRDIRFEFCWDADGVKLAMDQYAKLIAIGFTEWKGKNFKKSIGGFTHIMGDFICRGTYDDEQLYNLYLESLNNKK